MRHPCSRLPTDRFAVVVACLAMLAFAGCGSSGRGGGSGNGNDGDDSTQDQTEWGTPQLISYDAKFAIEQVQGSAVVADDEGNVTVAWAFLSELPTEIQANVYRNGAWRAPATISGTDVGEPFGVLLVPHPNREVSAVWRQEGDNTMYNPWVNHTVGGVWQGPTMLGVGDNRGGCCGPVTVVDSEGVETIIWEKFVDSIGHQLWSRRDGGDLVPMQEQIDVDNTTGNVESHVATVDENDVVTAAWYHFDEVSGVSIRTSRFESGSWSEPLQVDPGNATNGPGVPKIAADRIGNVIVAWPQFYGPEPTCELWANRYSNNTWGGAQRIGPQGAGHCQSGVYSHNLHVVSSPNGSAAIVVWLQSINTDNTTSALYLNTFEDGHWNTPTRLDDHPENTLASSDYPVAGVDDDGNIVVVWMEYDSDMTWSVWARSRIGGNWNDPQCLDSRLTSYPNSPQVWFGPGGESLAVWIRDTIDEGSSIRASRILNGMWSSPNDLMPSGSLGLGDLGLVVDSLGIATLTWAQGDSNGGSEMWSIRSLE